MAVISDYLLIYMITFKHIILFVIIFITLKEATALVELSKIKDNYILETNSILRDITNKLFTSLKLKGIKEKSRAKHYSLIHHYFVSLTLEDTPTLKQIVKLSRVDYTNYNVTTKNLVNTINSIYDTDYNILTDKANGNVSKTAFNYTNHIENYIDSRLVELEYLQAHSAKSPRVNIHKDILSVFNNEAQNLNGTSQFNDFFGNLSVKEVKEDYYDFWKPDPIFMDGRRIYSGTRTKIKYYPFMASIEIFKRFTCAGSIISSDLVISAASCLQLAYNNRFYRENPTFLRVRVGSNFYNNGGETIKVLEIYFYPKYNPKTLSDNIVVLRLLRQIRFKSRKNIRVKMIDFDRLDSPLPMNVAGVTIVGWGAQTRSNIVKSPWESKISFAILGVYPLDECQNIYSRQYVGVTNFCAGFLSKGTGACNQDVGGPGVVSGKLTGVISFGSPVCGTPNAPTVFTKVGYYADWIEEVIEQVQNAPRLKQETTMLVPLFNPYSTLTQEPTETVLTPVIEEVPLPIVVVSPTVPELPQTTFKEQLRNAPETPKPKKGKRLWEFNQFLKSMFNTEEIEDYLETDKQDARTDLKNPQASEEIEAEEDDEKFTTLQPAITTVPTIKPHKSVTKNPFSQHQKPIINRLTTPDNVLTPPKKKTTSEYKTTNKEVEQIEISGLLYGKNKPIPYVLPNSIYYSDKPLNNIQMEFKLPEKNIKYSAIQKYTSPKIPNKFYNNITTINYFEEPTSPYMWQWQQIPLTDRSHQMTFLDIVQRAKHNTKTKEQNANSAEDIEYFDISSENNHETKTNEENANNNAEDIEYFDISFETKPETSDNALRYDNNVFDQDNEEIKTFDENDMIDTKELEINMDDDNQKAIHRLLNDDVLGDKFVGDDNEDKDDDNDAIDETKNDGGILVDDDEVEKVEVQEDNKEGIMLPEDLEDLTFKRDKKKLSEKLIIDILSEFIAAQTKNLTSDDMN